MSALARYFLHEGKQVAGYDRTASELTRALECEGAAVTYEDEADTIPEPFIRRRSRPIVCSSDFSGMEDSRSSSVRGCSA